MKLPKPNKITRALIIGFLVGLLLLLLLAEALSLTTPLSYGDALYSTILSALLVGPTVQPTYGPARVVIIASIIDGLALIELSAALVILAVKRRLDQAELDDRIEQALRKREGK